MVSLALANDHMQGIYHLNLHANNVFDQCVIDYGYPLAYTYVFTELHEKIFRKMLTFYPPNILYKIRSGLERGSVVDPFDNA